MDIDALARQVVTQFARADLASPPLPPYLARWAEREQARAVEAYGSAAAEPPPDVQHFDSVTEHQRWRLGDLDARLYRIEPTASALLLVVRGETLAYVAFAGQWFMLPDGVRDQDQFPPHDLATMAIWYRIEGELDLMPGGILAVRDQPVHVGFQMQPSRYAALDDAQRVALHAACILIARDAALLFCGWSGQIVVTLAGPDPREHRAGQAEPPHQTIATFDVP
jgi:hypothetical protein